MSTAGDMIARIADEMDDDDLSSGGQALKAINSAVQEYRDKRFWFNQVINKTFSATAATEYLIPTLSPAITGISSTEPLTVIDLLTVDDGSGSNYRRVVPADDSYIDAAQTSTATGRPLHFSLIADATGMQLRLYPIPDRTYNFRTKALIRFADFTSDTGDNPWVNDAETLIRQAAKRILMSDITKELPPGSPPTAGEMKAFSDLQKATRLRMGSASMRADDLVAMQGTGGRYDISNDMYR